MLMVVILVIDIPQLVVGVVLRQSTASDVLLIELEVIIIETDLDGIYIINILVGRE